MNPLSLRSFWRVFRTAAGLGWKIESNWTDPFLFAVYSVAKPVAHAAILVVMYLVVSRGRTDGPLFNFIFLGNAFYLFVMAVIVGISFGVQDDRERYRTLKYIYLAPVSLPVYLLGRSVAQVLTGGAAVLVTLAFGLLFFHLPIHWSGVDWALLAAAMAVGTIALALIGLIVAGITLLTAHQNELVGVAVASALYLICGAIFPLEVLPRWISAAGYTFPVTWWLELIRRALVGGAAAASPSLAGPATSRVLQILLLQTMGLAGVAWLVFRGCEHRARERGLLERVTNY